MLDRAAVSSSFICLRAAPRAAAAGRLCRLGAPRLALARAPFLAARPAGPHAAARALSTRAPAAGVSVVQMAAGMVVAAAGGIGIGIFMPSDWLVGGSKDGGRREATRVPSTLGDAASSSSDDGVVHENVRDIAEDIPRPAIIQDATRAQVESLYEFHTCVASGGSATVWRATEIATGRTVAIKVVDKRLLLSPFLNMEVASLVRCTGHPHIVQLYAAYDVAADEVSPEGEWHLVMELAEGGELFERLLEHGAYTEKVASQLLRQVAKAVYHLHSVGICHRDVKPENVVLTSKAPDSPVKLIDFGAAVLLEEGEQVIAGGKVGTWTYCCLLYTSPSPRDS